MSFTVVVPFNFEKGEIVAIPVGRGADCLAVSGYANFFEEFTDKGGPAVFNNPEFIVGDPSNLIFGNIDDDTIWIQYQAQLTVARNGRRSAMFLPSLMLRDFGLATLIQPTNRAFRSTLCLGKGGPRSRPFLMYTRAVRTRTRWVTVIFILMAALVCNACSLGSPEMQQDQTLVPPVLETPPEIDYSDLQPCVPGGFPPSRPHPQVIEGGVLNQWVVCGPLPEFKTANRQADTIKVDVVFDTVGRVVKAKCDDTDPEVAAAAVKAAKLTYFRPVLLGGIPQSVHGVLVYAHSPARGVWFPAKMPVTF